MEATLVFWGYARDPPDPDRRWCGKGGMIMAASRTWLLLASVLAVNAALFTVPVMAADDNWDGSKGNGSWSDATRWSLGRPPGPVDAAFLRGLFNQTVILPSDANAAQSVIVGGQGGTITLANGAGTLSVSRNLSIGDTLSRGSYVLSGGTLSTGSEGIGSGFTSIGTFTHTAGQNSTGNFTLGFGLGSSGTYTLSGSGVLTAASESIGIGAPPVVGGGTGVFNQSGGVNAPTVITIGLGGANGSYNLSDGLLKVEVLHIGTGGIQVGTNAMLRLTGSGQLQAPLNGLLEVISGGRLIQDGGTLQTGSFQVSSNGTSGGTVVQSGGTTSADSLVIGGGALGSGIYSLSNGTLNITKILETNAPNAGIGTFNLNGGTLNGVLRPDSAATFNNNGVLNWKTGKLNINLHNSGTVTVSGPGVHVTPPVLNLPSGLFKVTGTTVSIRPGSFLNEGTYKSDPAVNLFATISNGSSAVLLGGRRDLFSVSGDFFNHSLRNTDWNTDLATLRFTGSGHHRFELAGADFGPGPTGYVHNFAFGVLSFDHGVLLDLEDGNAIPGAALYVREVDLPGHDLSALRQITTAFNIYYDRNDHANAYLYGRDLPLKGGGKLIAAKAPVPEPTRPPNR
jgi:hypothetical protein